MKDFYLSKNIKKIIALLIILILISVPISSHAAFRFWPFGNTNNSTEMVDKKQDDITQYTNFLNDIKNFTQNIDKNQDVNSIKISIFDKLTELQEKYKDYTIIPSISNKILNTTITSQDTNSSQLINTITSTIQSLLGNTSLAIKSLEANVVVDDMVATTAGNILGEKYKVNLSGNIYYSSMDSTGKPTSNKWVILVHGFMMNGQAIADALGQMYLDQGFNILAPDLRGFGNSGGSEGMGYSESLDIWDWLTYLNSNYTCSEIIVHGVSLGGATTVFLSGLEVDGKTLKDQHVIGLVEDCGYTSMTGIVEDLLNSLGNNELVAKILGIFDKTDLTDVVGRDAIKDLIINKVDVGIPEEKFDELENALNSLNRSSTPLLIVHGTNDTTVPFKNSTEIYNTALNNTNIPYIQRFEAEGEPHAFIIIGNKQNVYKGHVENFIQKAEQVMNGESVDKESDYEQETEQKPSLISSLINVLKLIKNMLNF